jgi:hypothetical protein
LTWYLRNCKLWFNTQTQVLPTYIQFIIHTNTKLIKISIANHCCWHHHNWQHCIYFTMTHFYTRYYSPWETIWNHNICKQASCRHQNSLCKTIQLYRTAIWCCFPRVWYKLLSVKVAMQYQPNHTFHHHLSLQSSAPIHTYSKIQHHRNIISITMFAESSATSPYF